MLYSLYVVANAGNGGIRWCFLVVWECELLCVRSSFSVVISYYEASLLYLLYIVADIGNGGVR